MKKERTSRHVRSSQPSLKSVSTINFLIRQRKEVSGIVLCQNCEVILHLCTPRRQFHSFLFLYPICQLHERFFILSPNPKKVCNSSFLQRQKNKCESFLLFFFNKLFSTPKSQHIFILCILTQISFFISFYYVLFFQPNGCDMIFDFFS